MASADLSSGYDHEVDCQRYHCRENLPDATSPWTVPPSVLSIQIGPDLKKYKILPLAWRMFGQLLSGF
jgi:hypothetical protein